MVNESAGKLACPKLDCGAEIDWWRDRCPMCFTDVGAPNVREVGSNRERDELNRRYQQAHSDAITRGSEERLKAFEDAVRHEARTVINMWPSLAAEFLASSKPLYSNYVLQVQAETRKPAGPRDDRQRRGTEGTLFGSYAHQVRYGALSLDGTGLISYGSCSVSIANARAAATATLLEENSYTFVRRHQILPGSEIPPGYRATWEDRHKLAIAKLGSQIQTHTTDSAFSGLVLRSDGNRADDTFIEVHLYGSFDHQAIDGVIAPEPDQATAEDRAYLMRIREHLQRLGKTWNVG